MFEVRVGPTYADAVAQVRGRMEPYRAAVERTLDPMARMDTRSAEVAAAVHHLAAEAERATGAPPDLRDVLQRMEQWKPGRFDTDAIVDAVALLCMRGWSRVAVDEETESLVEQRLSA
jgi:hypothetical protein